MLLGADAREPLGATVDDERHVGQRLDVVDRRRHPEDALLGGERRLHARIGALAFERLHQGRLLAADVRASTGVHDQVGREVRAQDVLAQVAAGVRLVDRRLYVVDVVVVLAADVEVARLDRHRVARERDPLDHQVRVVLEDLPVLERARLGLVAVAAQVARLLIDGRHKAPLQAGREAGAAAALQARRLDLVRQAGRVELAVAHDGFERVVALIGFVDLHLVEVLDRRQDDALVRAPVARLGLSGEKRGSVGHGFGRVQWGRTEARIKSG